MLRILILARPRSCIPLINEIASFLTNKLLFAGAQDPSSRKFRDFLQDWPTPGTGPYFDTSINSNITGLVGKPVDLHCKVRNLGNRTVSTMLNDTHYSNYLLIVSYVPTYRIYSIGYTYRKKYIKLFNY